jgi:hypothetical protein
VEDTDEKNIAMQALMETQTKKKEFVFDERLLSIVTVMRIDVETISAKYRPLPGEEKE